MLKNYEWYIKTDTSKYVGKWIAIINRKINVSGYDAKIVYKKSKEKYFQGGIVYG